MHPSFQKLLAISKETTLLSSVSSLLDWDQETYMPQGAIDIRSMQSELIAGIVHKEKTSSKFAKALSKLVNLETGALLTDGLDPVEKAAVKEWRREYLQCKKLPAAFVKKLAKTTSEAQHAWAGAKRHNSFKEFAPHLEKIVKLLRKKADYLGFTEHPYDALLDLYEPEMKTSFLIPLFGQLKLGLTELLKEVTSHPSPRADFLHKHYASGRQLHIGHILLKEMGFDEKTSRLDQSMHPFCSGFHPRDTRMTTKINPEDPLECFFAVMHEGGHGLYNMGHPEEYFGSPICESISLGIEESQSRWWETLIGHSFPFWKHFYPIFQKEFPENLADVSVEDFTKAINIVKPSLIRFHADEVTYNLHITLRFEIEKGLIEGSLKVKEIPDLWHAKMREYLGIEPSGHFDGCLQDIHWAMGGMGYFPTYTLGNLYAAQFFTAFEKTHPDWKEKVSHGNLLFIKEWLCNNIHKFGKQFSSSELCKHVTGKELGVEAYLSYLTHKFKR